MFGSVTLKITCAEPGKILTHITEMNVILQDINMIDPLTVQITVSRIDYRRIRPILEKRGCKIKVTHREGIYWKIKSALGRPVLLFGIMVYALCVLYVPGCIFFVRVEGNHTVPDRVILEAASQCGIGFGANRRQVRSEKVKNALLEKIPLLQWAGVNTNGCVAIISVRERAPEETVSVKPPCSIVALRDAIIREINVLRGTPLCKVGEAVHTGQILVSGYKDYGIAQQLSHAEAEIIGETERNLEVITPSIHNFRKEITRHEVKYSLIIGKKQINFFKDSGISPVGCVKMYEKTYLTLPGDFVLPVALVTQRITYYKLEEQELNDFSFLESFSDKYLQSQMIAGTILQSNRQNTANNGIYSLLSKYSCRELVGRIKYEEFMNDNG